MYDDRTEPLTPAKAEQLMGMTRIYFRNNRHLLATFEHHVPVALARYMNTVAPAPVPGVITVIFRPAGDRWAIGLEGDVRLCPYFNDPRPLQAAHAAFSGCDAVGAADYVREGSKQASNSLRGALHGYVARWVAIRTGCQPLADAFRRIKVARSGAVSFDSIPGLLIRT